MPGKKRKITVSQKIHTIQHFLVPSDIFIIILSYLTHQDRKNLFLINKKFREYHEQSFYLFFKVNYNKLPNEFEKFQKIVHFYNIPTCFIPGVKFVCLKTVSFSANYIGVITKLPDTVEELITNADNTIEELPTRLKKLILSDQTSKVNFTTLNFLEYFQIGKIYEHEIDFSMMPNLHTLVVGFHKDNKIKNLPLSVKKIQFTTEYEKYDNFSNDFEEVTIAENYKTICLPSLTKKLNISTHSCFIENWPTNLEKLHISKLNPEFTPDFPNTIHELHCILENNFSSNQITSLKNLETLTMDFIEEHITTLPTRLKNLSIGTGSEYLKKRNLIPLTNLEFLSVGTFFRAKIPKHVLSNLKFLVIKSREFHGSLEGISNKIQYVEIRACYKGELSYVTEFLKEIPQEYESLVRVFCKK